MVVKGTPVRPGVPWQKSKPPVYAGGIHKMGPDITIPLGVIRTVELGPQLIVDPVGYNTQTEGGRVLVAAPSSVAVFKNFTGTINDPVLIEP